MRRNRTRELLVLRQKNVGRGESYERGEHSRVEWEYDYYHFKNELETMHRKNEQSRYFLTQYQRVPSLFNLRQLESHLNLNCRKIDQIDHWISQFTPSPHASPPNRQVQQNIRSHFQQQILTAVRHIFTIRETIQGISQQQQQQFENSRFLSQQDLNNSRIESDQRQKAVKQVSQRIEGLNAILRRMGDVVAAQGELVNRIDQNLTEGHGQVKSGREALEKRARNERGEDDQDSYFNCSSKVNKVINLLYLINLLLILILIIRNL